MAKGSQAKFKEMRNNLQSEAMKRYEASAADKKMDKKMGTKEGSKVDLKSDKKGLEAKKKKK
ncbi:hypothetical protein KIH86_23965 [Paenibacillus sp. HN-1]|uniref:hypothetical protein n=1 Tax=Paenibacillus TaxID=44249 RepID=UPI001CA9FC81|nr:MULTISPECIES: hypothetical protein [Paenibacillus]MBY9081208.1 hypothetical protein [Paenibacillus sp. CGMCC 1.18879]MBY9087245.1 hypothetical protein [Paenibacillus sinensis]